MISIIVAVAHGGVIGKSGALPWKLPGELARFKQITMGHPIIMGRKTHESIGRALPGRTNIVISSDPAYKTEGCVVVGSLDKSIVTAKGSDGANEIFVIGGESVFAEALSLTSRLYLTKVDADIDGDRFFKFDESQWEEVSSKPHPADAENKYPFEFTIWQKKS